MKTFLYLYFLPIAFAQNWLQYQGREYLIGPQVQNYAEAVLGCSGRNGRVAKVDNQNIYKFLKSTLNAAGSIISYPYSYYVGAKRDTNTGRIVWGDGSAMIRYGQWIPQEPNNSGGNEDCVIMGWLYDYQPAFKWFDVSCSSTSRYICEKNDAGSTLHPTTTTFSTTTTAIATSLATTLITTAAKTEQTATTTAVVSTSGGIGTTSSSGNQLQHGNNDLYLIVGAAVGGGVIIVVIIFIVVCCVMSHRRKEKGQGSSMTQAGPGNYAVVVEPAAPEETYSVPRKVTSLNGDVSVYATTAYDVVHDVATYSEVKKPHNEEDSYDKLRQPEQLEAEAYDQLQHGLVEPESYDTLQNSLNQCDTYDQLQHPNHAELQAYDSLHNAEHGMETYDQLQHNTAASGGVPTAADKAGPGVGETYAVVRKSKK